MIDTIKVKIPVSLVDRVTIQDQCTVTKRTTPGNPYDRSVYYTQLISQNRSKVQITLGEDCIFVEFSVPKYLYGHNVFLINKEELKLALDDVKNVLLDTFKGITLPPYEDWILRRVDFCYAWRFPDDEIARTVLAGLKPFKLPRKDQIIYDTTIYWRGVTKTTRAYLKHPEFMNKDYKELRKWGLIELAATVEQESRGVLRFEVELRDEALTALFGHKDVIVSKLLELDWMKYMQSERISLIGSVNYDLHSWSEAFAYILQTSPRRQAPTRIMQLLVSLSEDPAVKELENLIPKSTRKRNEAYYREHELLALPFVLPFEFGFDIPSPLEPIPTHAQP